MRKNTGAPFDYLWPCAIHIKLRGLGGEPAYGRPQKQAVGSRFRTRVYVRSLARGLLVFGFFYCAAWAAWFMLFTGGEFAFFFPYFISSWSIGGWGVPLLIQVFALGTAIFSTWALHALNELDWF
jgi:hypothetical protein